MSFEDFRVTVAGYDQAAGRISQETMRSEDFTAEDVWLLSNGSDEYLNTFELPADCKGCRAFQAVLERDGGWTSAIPMLLSEFRLVHHNPRYSLVDRYQIYVEHLEILNLRPEQLRDLVRLVVTAEQS